MWGAARLGYVDEDFKQEKNKRHRSKTLKERLVPSCCGGTGTVQQAINGQENLDEIRDCVSRCQRACSCCGGTKKNQYIIYRCRMNLLDQRPTPKSKEAKNRFA